MSVLATPLTEAPPDRRRWIALAVIVTAQFMVVLDVAIVNVALPTIKTDLHFSQESLQWVVTAYSILFGGVLLLGGRMACSWPASRSSPSARCSTGSRGPRAH
jgi:MFS family permease